MSTNVLAGSPNFTLDAEGEGGGTACAPLCRAGLCSCYFCRRSGEPAWRDLTRPACNRFEKNSSTKKIVVPVDLPVHVHVHFEAREERLLGSLRRQRIISRLADALIVMDSRLVIRVENMVTTSSLEVLEVDLNGITLGYE